MIPAESIWGDYDDVLIHGMTSRDEESGGLSIHRTGPYVPPISFPGIDEIIVTDDFRLQLTQSDLLGLSFLFVKKKHIVQSDWHEWNKNAEEPNFYPASGEPEDYILDQPDSRQCAEEMPCLWELNIDRVAHFNRDEMCLAFQSWQGQDVFRASGVRYNFVTEKAKIWLENVVPDCANF